VSQENSPTDNLMIYTSDIVRSFVMNHNVSRSDLTKLITSVYNKLSEISAKSSQPASVFENKIPAIPIKKSLNEEELICLECGKAFKSIKRHLLTAHGLTPQAYRSKWELPPDYPMVAPAYAKRRSSIAKNFGLGNKEVGNTKN